jgi:hypothetical protein
MTLLDEDLRSLAASAKALRAELEMSLKLGLPADDAPFEADYRQALDRLRAIEQEAASAIVDFAVIATNGLGLTALLPHIPAALELVLDAKRVMVLARGEIEQTGE